MLHPMEGGRTVHKEIIVAVKFPCGLLPDGPAAEVSPDESGVREHLQHLLKAIGIGVVIALVTGVKIDGDGIRTGLIQGKKSGIIDGATLHLQMHFHTL